MWLHPHAPELRLREGPGGPVPGSPEQQPAGETTTQPEPLLVCAACSAPITQPEAAIDVNGAHAHTFLNPAGEVYRVRCFAHAPGALPVGEESDYWTWFAGHRWQVCVCRACSEHLGWRFSGAGAPFFGLIHERVVER